MCIVSISSDDQMKRVRGRLNVPELNGTTEENGEYGSASSRVSTLALLLLEPFIGVAPFEPFAMPF